MLNIFNKEHTKSYLAMKSPKVSIWKLMWDDIIGTMVKTSQQ